MQQQQSDEELIKKFTEGDEHSFVLLMRRHKDPITNFAFRFLGNYDDAIDIAQETLLRVYRFGHTYAGDVKFTTWLYTIASNLSKSELKRYRRKFGSSLQTTFRKSDEDPSWDIPDETYRPDDRVDNNTIAQSIQSALMKVSPTYREMIILRDLQQLSYEEISEVTKTELGTVKSRINRGRAQLQEQLRGLYAELYPELQ